MAHRRIYVGPKRFGGLTNGRNKPSKKQDTPPPKIKRQKRDPEDGPDHLPAPRHPWGRY